MTAHSDVRINACHLSFMLSVPNNSSEPIQKKFSISPHNCEIEFVCYHKFPRNLSPNKALELKIIGLSSNSNTAQMFGIISLIEVYQQRETVIRMKSLRQEETFQIVPNSAMARPTSNSASSSFVQCDFVIWGLSPNDEMTKKETLQSLVLKDFERMYSEGLEHDVCFEVGGGITLRAHRAVLRARSPVFQKMFEVEMREKASGRVPISDCSPEAFDCFLRFLYSGEVQSEDLDVLLAVYGAADKYSVPELKQRCSDIMRATLTVQGACVVLAHALLHEDKVTVQSARDFVVSRFTEVVWQPTWADFIVQHPNIAKELSENFSKN